MSEPAMQPGNRAEQPERRGRRPTRVGRPPLARFHDGAAPAWSVGAAPVGRVGPALLLALALLPACGAEGEIEQPTPLFGEVPIEYPLHMWDQDMQGETLLRVRVGDTGAVDSVEIVESSGYASFDSAAVEGARRLRFTPARQGGERIEVWAQVPVRFSKKPRPDTLDVSPAPTR